MKNLKNKKGFTLVELLAVIVVLAIVMALAVVGITSVLDNTRKSAMLADAKSFLEAAHSLVRADEAKVMLGEPSSITPDCGAGNSKTIDLVTLQAAMEQGGKKSPYGRDYTGGENGTRVIVESVPTNCSYKYSVFVTDGVYIVAAANKTSAVEETALTTDNVQTTNSN